MLNFEDEFIDVDEQAKRHKEFQAYMQKYLECVEKARAEESNK